MPRQYPPEFRERIVEEHSMHRAQTVNLRRRGRSIAIMATFLLAMSALFSLAAGATTYAALCDIAPTEWEPECRQGTFSPRARWSKPSAKTSKSKPASSTTLAAMPPPNSKPRPRPANR